MIDLAKINSLTTEEVLVVNELQKIAKEAEKASELIHKTYRCFGISEKSITILSDGTNTEWLSYDGIWRKRYFNIDHYENYSVKCTPDGIFEYYRAEFLYYRKHIQDDKEIIEKKIACEYFREFLRRTEEKFQTLTEK